MSKTDGKPEFMFEGPKGLIVFATTGVSESSGDKRLVVFDVSHVADVAAGFVTSIEASARSKRWLRLRP
ncbi:MAG: hypothetical protein MZV65_33395 [Chromatiales bacterium]|nr:hypothetical protein [Chromatiales bacterium]